MKRYEVTCYSTLLHKTTFVVEAESEKDAIDAACNRTEAVVSEHDEFLETVSETEWHAQEDA
jgi:hypothetical protein